MRNKWLRGTALAAALMIAASAMLPVLAQSLETEPEPETETEVIEVPEEPVIRFEGEYVEGRQRVTDGTLWGYAGVGGDVVIQPQFESVGDFFLGSALVTKEGKVGLLRWDGVFLLKPEYDELTEVGYGTYLGRRGTAWDLLSISAMETPDGKTNQLYADQISVTVYPDAVLPQIVLRSQDGGATRILVNALPQLLETRRIPGWQFPLLTGRKAEFEDVSDHHWFDRWVNLVYSVGMMEGTGEGKFEPLRSLTVAETIRLAACLESRAMQDDFHLQELTGPRWYSSSVAYCEASGIISRGEYSEEKLNQPITRAEMAAILSATTPVRGMKKLNQRAWVEEMVPDVEADDYAADAIYGLYAKGILNGTDNTHSFDGDEELSRAEAAAIIARIARPEQRITFWVET